VSKILQEDWEYGMQGLRKTREGSSHPDRDAQFQSTHPQCQEFQHRGQPVISVDSQKKELVENFKNAVREWHPQGKPEAVRVHDFADQGKGQVTPQGVYDLGRNQGVSVGMDHDTAEFAVDSIRHGGNAWASPAIPRLRNY
jgi:hypothetical protein